MRTEANSRRHVVLPPLSCRILGRRHRPSISMTAGNALAVNIFPISCPEM